ncbi:MAG: glycoside hydrolase family 127 protein, partial [Acidobacteria bacterium]|nr:glycoside hydrolase family 127 protein [Acidobacteriota bacterium]
CDELWRTDPGKLAAELTMTTCECCCAHSTMKLTRHLYGSTADPKYFDYYERALFNRRRGTINPEDGATMYFVLLASGYWKFCGSRLNTFWCCMGTGVEEDSKFADSNSWHDTNGIFVNPFIPSDVRWKEKGIRLKQETRVPENEGATLAIEAEKRTSIALRIRVPDWAVNGVTVKVNGKPETVTARPTIYVTLSRTWKTGDWVEIGLVMALHTHAIPDDATLQVMKYVPLLLHGRLGTEGLTKEMMYGGYDTTLVGAPIDAPEITSGKNHPTTWVECAKDGPLAFSAVGQSQPIALARFYKIWGERYATYWQVKSM